MMLAVGLPVVRHAFCRCARRSSAWIGALRLTPSGYVAARPLGAVSATLVGNKTFASGLGVLRIRITRPDNFGILGFILAALR